MKQVWLTFLALLLMMTFLFSVPVYADAYEEDESGDQIVLIEDDDTATMPVRKVSHMEDEYGLISLSEQAALNEKMTRISENSMCDISVVVLNAVPAEFDDLESYAVYLYYSSGYDMSGYQSSDGVILFLSVSEREWFILNDSFTDRAVQTIADIISPELSAGNFYRAFDRFADTCEEYLLKIEKNEPYGEPAAVPFTRRLGIGALIGAAVSFIIMFIMRGKMKTVHAKTQANNYVRENSLDIRKSTDSYLSRNVSKIPINQSSSSSRSKSSKGVGGKF